MKDYFQKEKRILKAFGISFTGNESIAYKSYTIFLILSCNAMYPFLLFMEIFKHDFDAVSNMMVFVFSSSIALGKTLVMLRNRILIGKMLNKLEEEPFTVNVQRGGVQEEEILKDCLWITGLQTQVYVIVACATMLTAALYTAFRRITNSDYQKWELPYGPLTVLNITYSPNYEITWLYENVGILSVSFHFVATDLLVAAVLAHISYQFKMLQNCIARMMSKSWSATSKFENNHSQQLSTNSNTDSFALSWTYLQQPIKDVVEYHSAILNLAKQFENVFSDLLLVIFLGTLGMLCFSIFQASRIQNTMQSVKCIQQIMVSCLQVVMVCYWGEQVIHESQKVGQAAFSVNFVATDVRFQKSLAMIIRRSQNPTKITAGKFTDICLETFAWVLRTSYSSFMVIRGSNTNKA